MTTPRYPQILSTGRYVPEKVLTNDDLDALLGESVGPWLVKNVGIEARHVMAEDERTSDMAVAAARQALDRAGMAPEELDLIIIATDTPDYISPSTASVVQAKLGAVNAGTFDINSACAGWVIALDQAAKSMIADVDYNRVLVVGVYGMTKFIDWTDKKTCTLFADGAGAVVLGTGDEPGYLGAKMLARGEYHDALGVFTGGTAHPATPESDCGQRQAPCGVCAQIPGHLQHGQLAAPDPRHPGQGRSHPGRRGSLRLHPAQPAHHRGHHAGAGPAHVQDPLDHGQMGLHRLGLHPHGLGRCGGKGQGQARRRGALLRPGGGLAMAVAAFRWS